MYMKSKTIFNIHVFPFPICCKESILFFSELEEKDLRGSTRNAQVTGMATPVRGV